MAAPPTPSDETRRLETLRALDLLDSAPEERFDRVTRLAKQIFSTPIALVSLVDADRQWFKSSQGLQIRETERNVSFCGYAILDDRIMVVNDTAEDARFCTNPLVCGEPNIRFYAGYPLSAPDGSRVGTLCIIDQVVRQMSEEQLQLLRELGRMVEEELVEADHATIDPITSLSNRNGFLMVADHLLSMCIRRDIPATALLFHFENLAQIDGDFGRKAGDAAAIELAHELISTFRNSDVIARIASDLFCVLLAGTSLNEVAHARRRFSEDMNDRNRDVDNHRKIVLDIDPIAFKANRHGDAKGLIREAEDRTNSQRVSAA